MEMTQDLSVLAPPPYLAGAARLAGDLVAAVLAGEEAAFPEPADEDLAMDLAMGAATFLAHILFTTQIAGGQDPHQARALLLDGGRGPALARQFLGAGTIQIGCDYCGGLMVGALAAAAAGQMRQLHGDLAAAAWDQLARALMPAPAAAERSA